MKLREFIIWTQERLQNTNQAEAELIVCHICQLLKREDLLFNADLKILDQHLDAASEIIKRRNAQEPLSQILGYKDFWDKKIILVNTLLGVFSLLSFVLGVSSLILGAGVP